MNDTSPLSPDAGRVRTRLGAGNRPYVTLKAAATLDGKIATPDGESQWITGEAARAHAHRLRAGHAAVLVGIGTALADDPRLTVRLEGCGAKPARIVLDSRARIAAGARLLADDGARRIVIAGALAPEKRIRAIRATGAEVLRCGTARPEAREFLPWLREEGFSTVLVEGGAEVHGHLIAEREANELFLYLAGRLIGDIGAPGWCGPLAPLPLAETPRLELSPPVMMGEDLLVHALFPAR